MHVIIINHHVRMLKLKHNAHMHLTKNQQSKVRSPHRPRVQSLNSSRPQQSFRPGPPRQPGAPGTGGTVAETAGGLPQNAQPPARTLQGSTESSRSGCPAAEASRSLATTRTASAAGACSCSLAPRTHAHGARAPDRCPGARGSNMHRICVHAPAAGPPFQSSLIKLA